MKRERNGRRLSPLLSEILEAGGGQGELPPKFGRRRPADGHEKGFLHSSNKMQAKLTLDDFISDYDAFSVNLKAPFKLFLIH